ncbi:MAG: hypothetical protein JXA33_00335 [Anaerolineae bacterium]|nr:hypothetical protein [Anaerolineae bacterium]
MAASPEQVTAPTVYIYFFWGDGCPHCAEAKPFLQELVQRYPNMQVESFEVWYNADNQSLFQEMAAAHGFEPQYVPTIFIGDRHWVGFGDTLRQEIESMVRTCSKTGCPDAGAGVIPGHEEQSSQPLEENYTAPPSSEKDATQETENSTLTIYLFFGEGCSHCEVTHLEGLENHYPSLDTVDYDEIELFLQSLTQQYPQLQLQAYEVWYVSQNHERFNELAAAFGFEPRGVPTIFIGERYWEGYSAAIETEIAAYVQMCMETGCPDVVANIITGESSLTPAPPLAEPVKDTAVVLMNDLWSSVLIFGIAFGVAMLVLLVHRIILPRFGIVKGIHH